MTKGVLSSRSTQLMMTEAEARRVLKLTKSWPQTQTHLQIFIRGKFGKNTQSTNDYIKIIHAKLLMEPDTAKLIRGETGLPVKTKIDPKDTFIPASELSK